MRKAATVFSTALIGSLAGCGRPPILVNGPIDLTERPSTVRFIQAVPSYGRTWELCFEFDLPRPSRKPREYSTNPWNSIRW
jgi:hypothetical protein